MTEPTRTKAGRRARRSASQLFIAALVVFGVVASVLLLFSENVQWLRVGLVSALWAAIVGAFAMTKYRREAAADQAKAKDLQTVYELQLAREISARREYELGVESRIRSEVQLETSEIAALRTELAHLRNNLQMLFDGNLPAERVALRAEAMRLQELGGGRNYDSYQPAPSGLYVPGRGGRGSGAEEPVPGLATPYDEPVTAETSVLYPDTPIGDEPPAEYSSARQPYNTSYSSQPYNSQHSEPVAHETAPEDAAPEEDEVGVRVGSRRIPTPPRVSGPVGGTWVGEVDDAYTTPADDAAPYDAAPYDAAPSEPSPFEAAQVFVPEPPYEPEPAHEPEAAAFGEQIAPDDAHGIEETSPNQWDLPEPRVRRRRRAESEATDSSGAHSNGRSVAEILADMQSTSSEPSERRHRRRAD